MKNKIFAILILVSLIISLSFSSTLAEQNNILISTNSENEETSLDIYEFDEGELRVQEIAKKTGLHRNQVVALLGKGYTEKDILDITYAQADTILTEGMSYDEMSIYYTHVAPRALNEFKDKFPKSYFPEENQNTKGYCSICGYTTSTSVNWTHVIATGGYAANGCFHQNSGLTVSNVNSECYRAKLCGFNIFNLTSSTNLMYDYYMFGENYGADNPGWAHEGVDINYTGTNGRVVYAPISGHVHYINSSTIVIHPPTGSGSYSVNVQHLDNPIADGSNVTKGVTFIGNEGQGAGENHIHVGVCTHNGSNCTTIHSQKDLTLSCVAPYTYLD